MQRQDVLSSLLRCPVLLAGALARYSSSWSRSDTTVDFWIAHIDARSEEMSRACCSRVDVVGLLGSKSGGNTHVSVKSREPRYIKYSPKLAGNL